VLFRQLFSVVSFKWIHNFFRLLTGSLAAARCVCVCVCVSVCLNPLPEKPVRSMALRLVALMTVAVSLPAVGR